MKTATCLILMASLSCMAAQVEQTDWASGQGTSGPVSIWGDLFESCEDISWLSIPGQICLSSVPLAVPVVHEIDMYFAGAYTADVGDINGDGLADVVAGGYNANELIVWIADGQGGWDRNMVSFSIFGPCGVDIADIDNDGDPDILCAAYTGDQVLLYLNDGSTVPQWDEIEIESMFDGGHDIEAFDIDLDGDLDILAAAAEGDRVAWWRKDGGTPIQWVEQDISLTPDYPCRIQACDLNGDGNIDVTASAWQGSKVYVWYGSGGSSPSWTEQVINPDPIYGAHSVRACDIDLDGDPDLIVSAMSTGTLILFRNGGGSTVQWTRETIDSFTGCAYARPGDIDGDGDQDILASSFSTGGAAWWENNSVGTSWTKHTIATGMGSISCALPGDVDNDGDLDAVFTCFGNGEIHWSELTEFTDSGWLQSSVLDTGENPQWASIEWDSELPGGTTLTVKFKSSDDPGSMGSWSAGYSSPCEISGDLHRYFQYRIELTSSLTSASAILCSFRLNWDPSGISGQDDRYLVSLHLPGGNPARGAFMVELPGGLQQNDRVMILDTSGRMVWLSGCLYPGDRSINIPAASFPSGSYRICLLNEDSRTLSVPLVYLGN
jgi:hypothetical protein